MNGTKSYRGIRAIMKPNSTLEMKWRNRLWKMLIIHVAFVQRTTTRGKLLSDIQDRAKVFLFGVLSHAAQKIIFIYDKIYTGKTTHMLKQRISEHNSSIRSKNVNYPWACQWILSTIHWNAERGRYGKKDMPKGGFFGVDTSNPLQPTGLDEDFDSVTL